MSKEYNNHGLGNFQVYRVLNEKRTKLHGIFSLNPPATNVSFYSQQRRAVYVAAELHTKYSKNEENKRILIVGGGLSGTTCYFTLRALGHENVFLFEAGGEFIWSQSNAGHRFAHPSLAEWPKDDGGFSAATNLPLMNWHASQMDKCVKMILRDLTSELDDGRWSDNIFFHTVVTDLQRDTPSEGAQQEWTIQTEQYFVSGKENPNPRPTGFDTVILATGFGSEIEAPITNSEYWQFDIASRIRQDPRKYGRPQPVVIGGGDAALIDAARLCIGEAAEELSCRLIFDLRQDKHQKFDTNVSHPDASNLENQIADAYSVEKNMTNCAAYVPKDKESINEIVKKTIKVKSDGRSAVLLASPQNPISNPQQSSAVNVLLFALLQRGGRNGGVRLEWVNGTADTEKTRTIKIKDQNRGFHDSDYVFIFRCGSRPDWPKIEEVSEDETIEVGPDSGGSFGSDISEELALEITRGFLGCTGSYEGLDKHEINDKYRLKLVKRYSRKILGVSKKASKKMLFKIDNDDRRTVTIPVSFSEDLKKCKKIGGVDYTAFGIQLQYKNTDIISSSPSHAFDCRDINTGSAA